MQDDQIAYIKSMKTAGMYITWKDGQEHKAVLGFSQLRPHIMIVSGPNPAKDNKDDIYEIDARTLAIADFTVLNEIKTPIDLLDPVFLSI